MLPGKILSLVLDCKKMTKEKEVDDPFYTKAVGRVVAIIIFSLIILGGLVSFSLTGFLMALVSALGIFIALPYFDTFTKKNLSYKIPTGIKVVSLVALLFIVITLIPKDDTTQYAPQPEVIKKEPVQPTEQQKLFEIGDEIIAGEFKWKITKVTKQTEIGQYIGSNFLGVKANGEFLILDVEVENIGKSANYLTDSFIKLVDDQGREFSSNPSGAFYLDHNSAILFDTINPGIVKKGKVVFDVPVDLKVVNVRISNNLLESSYYNIKLFS